MTVHSLEAVKDIIDEIGPDKVKIVFRYCHTKSRETLYAVFMMGHVVDIYQSPYCEYIARIYDIDEGGWLE